MQQNMIFLISNTHALAHTSYIRRVVTKTSCSFLLVLKTLSVLAFRHLVTNYNL
jgi:uncharacterized protein (UPF0276 family)